MGQRHSRHALSWLKSQLHNPSLLCDRTPYTHLVRFHVSIVAMRRTHVEGGNTRRLLLRSQIPCSFQVIEIVVDLLGCKQPPDFTDERRYFGSEQGIALGRV